MDRLRSLFTLSVSGQAVLTGAVSAMMLGGSAAALVLRVADLPAPEPETSATGKQLKIVVVVPPPAASEPPKIATLAAPPRPLPFNPAETALAPPRPQTVSGPPPAEPRLETAVAPARLRPGQRHPEQRLGDSIPVAGAWAARTPPARTYPPPSVLAVAPQQSPPRGPAVHPGRPTDALAEARRAWALQRPPEEETAYADDERGVDPRDDRPPPGWRARQAYSRPVYRPPAYRQPADPRDYAADPYADRYPDPYADRYPDPYQDYDPYQRRR